MSKDQAEAYHRKISAIWSNLLYSYSILARLKVWWIGACMFALWTYLDTWQRNVYSFLKSPTNRNTSMLQYSNQVTAWYLETARPIPL